VATRIYVGNTASASRRCTECGGPESGEAQKTKTGSWTSFALVWLGSPLGLYEGHGGRLRVALEAQGL
jgi:hypothetical protein